jgi:hypothetical protein
MKDPQTSFKPSRRYLLQRSACGFGLMGLASMLGQEAMASVPENPLHGHVRSEASLDEGSWQAIAV